MFFLDVVRFEARLQWRSLRFRVGVALYLLLCSAPPIVLATAIQPQAPHDFGPASYVGWVFDICRFAGLILAVVVAGSRVDQTSQRQLWPVLAAAGIGNGGYLWRRWGAMAILLAAISAIPTLIAYGATVFLGLPPYDPAGYLVPWLLLVVAPMVMMSAVWLALVTIAGSELGALMLLYLARAVAKIASTELLKPHLGSTFTFDDLWLGFYRLQWGLAGLFESEDNRFVYGNQLRSDSHFDIAYAIDWWLARATPHMSAALLLMGLAVFFVRRTRSDVRPLVLRDGHPLRNILRFIHTARSRYAPDAALGSELWRVALGLLAVAGAFFMHSQRQGYFEAMAEERFRVQMQTDDQPTTPLDFMPVKRTVEGEILGGGQMWTQTRLVFENRGDQAVSAAGFTINSFLEVSASLPDGGRSLETDRRDDRFFVHVDPPVAPGESLRLEIDQRGRPRYVDFGLRTTWSRSFALTYQRHKKNPHHRSDIAASDERPYISRRSFTLGQGVLTPIVRYTTWQLTEPPALPSEPGLDLRPESVQPVEDLEIDLALPDNFVAGDACGHASIDESGKPIRRLRGQCRTALHGYLVRGGPLEVVASGDVVLLAQKGHEEQALAHLPAIEEVTELSADAWPGLEGVDSLVALEWPPRLNWDRWRQENQLSWNPAEGWTSLPPAIEGQLMSIPEARIKLRKPLSSAELVGRVLTRRLTEKRAFEPREQRVFRAIIAAAMSRRMGLASEGGATITGLPWNKFWAGQPILSAEHRHMMLEEKVNALAVELIARTGATAFYDGVNRFLDAEGDAADRQAESPESQATEKAAPGTMLELFSFLEESSGAELGQFWEQYFTDQSALPEMRLGRVDVRRVGEGFRVVGEVENTGTGVGRCPVVIKAEGQVRSLIVEAQGGQKTTFEVLLDRQPLSALLDPDRVCYRWVTKTSGMVERVALGEEKAGGR